MINIGVYNTLEIYREVDFGAYLTDGEDEVLLPLKYVPDDAKVGDHIEVFVYLDSEQRPVSTTLRPKAIVGDTALLKVNDVNKIGAFLDWGLEKDLLVPFKEQREPMVADREYVVRVILDEVSGRLMASNRMSFYAKPGHGDLKMGQEVDVLVCYEIEVGFAVLINDEYQGLLYKNEIYKPLQPGDREKGFISKLRPDGKNDVCLRKPGFAGVVGEKPLILEKLREADGFLPFNSKSSPEDIKKEFNMSKKVFKQAIGMLYKARSITISDDGINLVKK
jgi:uncharacterized protein